MWHDRIWHGKQLREVCQRGYLTGFIQTMLSTFWLGDYGPLFLWCIFPIKIVIFALLWIGRLTKHWIFVISFTLACAIYCLVILIRGLPMDFLWSASPIFYIGLLCYSELVDWQSRLLFLSFFYTLTHDFCGECLKQLFHLLVRLNYSFVILMQRLPKALFVMCFSY